MRVACAVVGTSAQDLPRLEVGPTKGRVEPDWGRMTQVILKVGAGVGPTSKQEVGPTHLL